LGTTAVVYIIQTLIVDINVQNAHIYSQLHDELPDMRVDLEAQSLLKRKKPA